MLLRKEVKHILQYIYVFIEKNLKKKKDLLVSGPAQF